MSPSDKSKWLEWVRGCRFGMTLRRIHFFTEKHIGFSGFSGGFRQNSKVACFGGIQGFRGGFRFEQGFRTRIQLFVGIQWEDSLKRSFSMYFSMFWRIRSWGFSNLNFKPFLWKLLKHFLELWLYFFIPFEFEFTGALWPTVNRFAQTAVSELFRT